MKKISSNFLPIAILTFVILASISSALLIRSIPAKNEFDGNGTIIASNSKLTHSLDSLNELVSLADNIVIGTIISENEFNKSTSEYCFAIDQNIKNDTNKADINVYETKGTLEAGEQYLLFLQASESVYFPDTIYTSVYKDSITHIDTNGTIKNRLTFNKKQDKQQFVLDIVGSLGISNLDTRAKDVKNYLETATIDNLMQYADKIVHVIPTKTLISNKYVVLANVSLLKTYKGSDFQQTKIVMPSFVEVGREYIVFLKEYEGSYKLASKDGSIICKEDAGKWEDAVDKLSAKGSK